MIRRAMAVSSLFEPLEKKENRMVPGFMTLCEFCFCQLPGLKNNFESDDYWYMLALECVLT